MLISRTRCCTSLTESVWVNTDVEKKKEGVIDSDTCWGGNSSTYVDSCLLLRCDAEQRIQRIYFRYEQNKDRSVTQKWKTPEWQERWRWRILLSLAATRSGTTDEICAASCVSKCARVNTVTRAQSCLWCSSVVSLKAYKAQFLSSLTYFRGRYDTLWLVLC